MGIDLIIFNFFYLIQDVVLIIKMRFSILVNTKINHTLLGEPIQRKGNTYMKLTKYTITLRPELVKFNFENLFNGNSRLGNELNNVLNDNWDAVFSDVREGYEKGLALVFQNLAHQVFTRVPLKNIFLD